VLTVTAATYVTGRLIHYYAASKRVANIFEGNRFSR
jgi:hypothetical protein